MISGDSDVTALSKWKYKASAEIYKQFNDFNYPYMSFYLYNKSNIPVSDRPPIVSYNFNEPSSLYNSMISP